MKRILVDYGLVMLQKINEAKFSACWCLRLSNILSPTPVRKNKLDNNLSNSFADYPISNVHKNYS